MRHVTLLLAASAFLLSSASAQRPGQSRRGTLSRFESDAEILSYLRGVREAQDRAREEARKEAERRAAAAAACKKRVPPVQITTRDPSASASAIVGGRVTDDNGNPVAHAQVSIAELGLKTTSAGIGSYRLVIPAESLATGRAVTLHTRMIGYEVATRIVTVKQRDSVAIDLRLCGGFVALDAVTVQSAVVAENAVAGFAARAAPAADGITNVQHAGVDEGGIVKLHGDHLVILRRGRLFTVALNGDLRPIAAVDAFGRDVNPRYTWYDELLIAEDRVVVVGYSYERGGTEIGVFRIDGDGGLRYLATYQLRSNDYYSSRNYASRLIGTKLIFYAPLYLWGNLDDPFAVFPALRNWQRRSPNSAFRRIAPAGRVYRTPQPVSAHDIALHTVTICDLAAADLACDANVIVGPSGRVFYVSPTAVYIWASSWGYRPGGGGESGGSMLYRMPLDGSAPSALGVSGAPVDQFSFLESEDGHLNVVVRSDAMGDAMWAPERAAGDVALLRVPLKSFGNGNDRVPWWRYRRLPAPAGYTFHNRFVGDHLLYGVGSGWGRPRADRSELYVVRWAKSDAAVAQLSLPHGVDRIEVMGRDAVIVGGGAQDLHFTGVRLEGAPEIAQRYTMPGASQGELRSHGFFYRSDAADEGVLGLPVRQPGKPGYRHLFDASAGIVFLRNSDRRFVPLGTLDARQEAAVNDRCKASCVDWYGNARPLFLRGRVFALLGYELVEGTLTRDAIREVQRVTYAPRPGVVIR